MGKRKRCTKKEVAFVDLWLKTGSMTDAYRGAYNTTMTGQALNANAKKVGRREHVAALYEEKKASLEAKARAVAEEKHGVTVDMIMREHKKIGFASMKQYSKVGPDGQPYVDFSQLTDDDWAAVGELTSEKVLSTAEDAVAAAGVEAEGDGKKPAVAVLKTKFKLHNKQASLVEMGKHLGMYEADNKQKAEAEAAAHVAAQARSNDDLARRLALILAAGARKAAKTPPSGSPAKAA